MLARDLCFYPTYCTAGDAMQLQLAEQDFGRARRACGCATMSLARSPTEAPCAATRSGTNYPEHAYVSGTGFAAKPHLGTACDTVSTRNCDKATYCKCKQVRMSLTAGPND